MQFGEYLGALPQLHSWDQGKSWGTGGFNAWHLERLDAFLRNRLPQQATLLETGAGNSTITFLFQNPGKVISIAPDADLFERIRAYCRTQGIPDAPLEAHVDGSQWVLPKLASANRSSDPYIDFALIDGCHGCPTAFVDLEYINFMLRPGGWLMVDDVQIHTAKEMARLLAETPGYAIALDLRKSLVFQKTGDQRHLGDWVRQPYIARRTRTYERLANRYTLGDPGAVADAAERAQRFARRALGRVRRLLGVGRAAHS